jgi:hypothetical protein
VGIQARGQDVNASFRKMKMALTAVPVIAVILLSGCTKGSSSSVSSGATYSPLTGVFSDAPVAGLTYKTSSGAAGTTDAQGRFNYASDSVTFSVGGMLVGTAVPQISLAGNAPVTPVDLIAGSTSSTTAVQTIGQLLGTLNSIAVAMNIDANLKNPSQPLPLASGVFTMPANAADILNPYYPTAATSLTGPQLQAIAASGKTYVTYPAASAVISVPTQADAQLNLNQAVNASSVIGTVWTGDTSGGSGSPVGTFYFQPDGNMTGFISYPNLSTPVPGLADGDIWAGTWSGSTTTSPGGVQFSLISSAGGNYTGTISNGTGTINNSSGPVFTLTQATSLNNTKLTNSLYLGGWYGVYTPVSSISNPNPDVYGAGTPVYLILSPDGNFSGIMDGNQGTTGTISGNWTPDSGIGSGSFVKNTTATFSFDMATQTGWYTPNGATVGYISFSRTGILSMNNDTLTSSTIAMVPLLLNVNISWPVNSGSAVSGFPLALNIFNGSAQLIASGIKSEINPLGNGAVAYTMTDSISVPYPTGIATNYTLSLGTTACNIAGASSITGTVSLSGVASPATVAITCP